jgi:hypothetical protein
MNPILNKVLSFIKENFIFVLILMLVCIIVLLNCDRTIELEKTITKIDTVYVKVKGDVIKTPPIVQTIPGEKEIQYIPDPSYEKLVIQYNKLVSEHTDKNISVDTININKDGLVGFIRIEDTINKNKISNRKTSYNFDFPILTKTITTEAPKKTQLYYGGGLMGGNKFEIQKVNVGLLLKTKNDHIYNVYGGRGIDGTYVVGVQAYWKIKLGK